MPHIRVTVEGRSTQRPRDHALSLSVSGLDVFVENKPRVAGIDAGRLYNGWLDCPYTIGRAVTSDGRAASTGFRWTARLAPLDDGHVHYSDLSGIAETRQRAYAEMVDTVTRVIREIVDVRRAGSSLPLAPDGTVEPFLPIGETVVTRRSPRGFWRRVQAFLWRTWRRWRSM